MRSYKCAGIAVFCNYKRYYSTRINERKNKSCVSTIMYPVYMEGEMKQKSTCLRGTEKKKLKKLTSPKRKNVHHVVSTYLRRLKKI